jgi:Protein of unknown function (DUF3108)
MLQENGFVHSNRLIGSVTALGAAVLALFIVEAGGNRALAQGRLDAQYTVTLAGLPVGYGTWTIDIRDDRYNMAASGATSGIMRVFASGRGQSSARGAVSGGQLVTSNYSSNVHTDKKYDEVRMVISGGNVKEFVADPPTVPGPERIPLTEAHRRGVADPMTAPLVRIAGSGDTVVPQACQRTLAIFDGRMRYDLRLAFKRFERVASQGGYQGLAVVCSVQFAPIAGHIPQRYAIRYLSESRDMELWFAPIAGTRLLAPYRASIPTPLGDGVMEATQFVSVPQASKAAARTQ